LSLALALVGRPDVAFLDEPTAEMDVEGRSTTWEIVRELRGRGAAVLLTTHQLDEAERLADRVAIIHRGKLVALGSPGELVSARTPEIVFTVATPIDHEALSSFLPATVTVVEGTTYRVSGEKPNPTLVSRVTTWLAARGVMVRTMRVGARSLEEIYLELTR
jgi:ABC-2 type transport system ATP-binding protein